MLARIWQLLSMAFVLVLAGVAISYLIKAKNPSDFDPDATAFIKQYFAVWSRHDLNAYANAFDSNAKIIVIDPRSSRTEYGLTNFLASQERAFAKYPQAYEEAQSIQVFKKPEWIEGEVRWQLNTGEMTLTGTDIFKLKKVDGRFRILELTVRNDSTPP